VVEVGMGGRLDATNVVTSDVAVIASISLDHGAILGNSLAEIAGEKAGIIKPGKPVVSAAQHPDAAAVVARTANEHGAPLFIAGRDWTSEAGERVRLAGPWGDLVEVEIALAGRHQVENAGLALMACWQLDQELAGNEAAVREGLRSVVWPGRFERIAVDPEIIVDGAHNVDSIERLVETLDERRQGRNLVVVLGVARDKDLAGMISVLARLDANVVATASHNPRAVEPAEIVRLATEAGLQASATEATSDAIAIAREEAGADGMVCITGSLYVVAEAREALGLAQTPAFERSLLYR
jgi:dihydrofolate synthase/folylpolyglutamate synthase